MNQRWRRTFSEWATTEEHQQAVQRAHERIAEALTTHRRAFVSYSGGKDSTALVHLVLQHEPEIMVLHWDYGRAFVPYAVHRAILDNATALGVKNLRMETSADYVRLGRKAQNVMGRHLIGRLLPALAAEGYDLDFVGLRAEESLKRRRRIEARRMVSVIEECWPLWDWRWLDVWAYIVAHNLPYLWLYDSRARLVGYELARFTTLFDGEFSALGADALDNVLHWRWRNEST